MFQTVLIISLAGLAIAMVICLYIIITGPSIPDRVLALDALSFDIIGVIAVLSMLERTKAYLDVILMLGILAFLGTVALSKFIESGVVIDRDRDS